MNNIRSKFMIYVLHALSHYSFIPMLPTRPVHATVELSSSSIIRCSVFLIPHCNSAMNNRGAKIKKTDHVGMRQCRHASLTQEPFDLVIILHTPPKEVPEQRQLHLLDESAITATRRAIPSSTRRRRRRRGIPASVPDLMPPSRALLVVC